MTPGNDELNSNSKPLPWWVRFEGVANRFRAQRSQRLSALIAEHLHGGMRVLDLGCGDLGLAHHTHARFDRLDLVAVDVLMPAGRQDMSPAIERVLYDGRRLPFADKCFDASYLAFVLHHALDHAGLLREALRVTRHSLIILEDVYQNEIEKWLLRFFDLGNLLRAPRMRIPFTFRREEEWLALLTSLGAQNIISVPIRPVIPKPTRHRKFIVTL